MYPISPEVVRAEQNRRHEGFRRWSLRHGHVAVSDIDTDHRPPQQGHQPKVRPAIGW